MLLTPVVRKALHVAAIYHHGQFRKGGRKIPYIVHPVAVACLVAEYGANEMVTAAALLHDTIEDTRYTVSKLQHEFGTDIRNLVLAITEKKKRGGTPIPWRERKEAYLANLPAVSDGAFFIALADKVSNMRDLIDLRNTIGEKRLWQIFPAGKQNELWYYAEVWRIATQRRAHTSILARYAETFDSLKVALNGSLPLRARSV